MIIEDEDIDVAPVTPFSDTASIWKVDDIPERPMIVQKLTPLPAPTPMAEASTRTSKVSQTAPSSREWSTLRPSPGTAALPSPRSTPRSSPHVRHAEDAGSLERQSESEGGEESEEEIILPPMYDPAWGAPNRRNSHRSPERSGRPGK